MAILLYYVMSEIEIYIAIKMGRRRAYVLFLIYLLLQYMFPEILFDYSITLYLWRLLSKINSLENTKGV